jgi:hypothetical protein
MSVSEKDISSQKRKSNIVDARKMYCLLCSQFDFTLTQIGDPINRHHSSVIHLRKSGEDLMKYDVRFKELYGKVQPLVNKAAESEIKFDKAPPLWPEEWTDHFVLNSNSDKDLKEQAVITAATEAGEPIYQVEGNHVYTNSQKMVDDLKDQLYGYEIPFQHTHIPEHYA